MSDTTAAPSLPASFGDRRRASASSDIDPWDILRAIWSRKERLLVLFAIFLCLGLVWIMSMTPTYISESQVSIKPRAGEVSRFDNEQRPPEADVIAIQSELQILTSGTLVPELVKKLRLDLLPEFNPSLRKPGALGLLAQALGISRKPQPATPATIREQVLERLSIIRLSESRIIGIRFTSDNAERAALLANTYAEIYISRQVSDGNALNSEATTWLKSQIDNLRDEVAISEAAVEQFRSQNGLFQTSNSTLPREELTQLSSQLVQAEAERSTVMARLSLARELVANEGAIDSTIEVLQSPLIQNLRQQEVQLRAQIAEFSATLLPSHPRMKTSEANLADLRLQIGREVAKLIRSLQNEAHIANERIRVMRDRVNRVKSKMSRLGQQEVELRALEREAAANRTLLEQFLGRYEAASARAVADTAAANATIVSKGVIPAKPAAPNKKAAFVLAIIGAAFGSLAIVFLMEALAPGFRTPEQVERQTGMPFLGILPDVVGARSSAGLAASIVRSPYGAISEAMRRLQSNVLMARIEDRPVRTVLVTSSVEQEGKSGVAGGLARLMAQSGYRVLLIDADLRHGALAPTLGLHPTWGLTEVLNGQAEFDRAVMRDHSSTLHILQSGGQSANPTALLNSNRMSWLLYALVQTYDYVIIDGPAVHAASEAPALSQLSDVTVMCVKWGKTNRRIVNRALKFLSAASTRRVGIFLTGVNRRQYKRLADEATDL
ncbi:MAG: polysaccharide biosynthesis tyrosine autokinase [Parvibaculum sp.]